LSDIPLWLSLVIKVVFAATVVVSATVLAEKSGPLVAGLIIAMPISVGPTYVMLALTTAPRFVAESALGSIAANAAVAVFGTVYVLLAQRTPMPVSLSLALAAWFGTAVLEQRWGPAPGTLVAFSTTMLVAGSVATRRALAGRKLLAGAKRWYDLPLRAAFVGVFAGALVTISELIGPGWTGLLAAFPLVLTTSIVLMHQRVGAAATAAVIATAVQGIVIYPCAFGLLYLFAVSWGVWWAMLACLALIVVWAVVVYFWRTMPARAAG
jgi:hypothetical protein